MFEVTQDWLHENLSYDPSTGIFHWKIRPARNVPVGSLAGRKDNSGRWGINIKNKKYASHRLAWLYVHGAWPPTEVQIDHINRDPGDNRITNLRCVTGSQNCMNRTYTVRGLNGEPRHATFHKSSGRWQSQAWINGKCRYLGLYKTFEEARSATLKALSL